MKILRVGGSSTSYTRFLDLLEDTEVESLVVLTEDEYFAEKLKSLKNVASLLGYKEDILKKLEVYQFKLYFFERAIRRLLYEGSRLSFWGDLFSNTTKYLNFPISMYMRNMSLKPLESILDIHKPDFIWSGSNDFDGSNFLTWWIKERYKNMPLIRSYKEHRCKFVLDEKNALGLSNAIIIPTERNLRVLEEVYSLKLKDKTYFADEDWRASKLVRYVRDIVTEKLSHIDGYPHVVILAGVATYGEYDYRRNSRYNYIDIIKTLTKNKIYVHLQAKKIIESTHNPVCSPTNPYFKLASECEYFIIEKPTINLDENLSDYFVLKKYDAGILHNYVEGEPINKFTKVNIPNRLYEYQMAGVLPIVIEGTILDVEDIIKKTNFGIIAKDYKEVAEILWERVKNKEKTVIEFEIPTFRNFTEVLFKAFDFALKNYQS